MRFLLGGSERDAALDVYGTDERSAAGTANHGRTDEGVSGCEGLNQRCVVEFSGQKTDQAI